MCLCYQSKFPGTIFSTVYFKDVYVCTYYFCFDNFSVYSRDQNNPACCVCLHCWQDKRASRTRQRKGRYSSHNFTTSHIHTGKCSISLFFSPYDLCFQQYMTRSVLTCAIALNKTETNKALIVVYAGFRFITYRLFVSYSLFSASAALSQKNLGRSIINCISKRSP